MASEKVFVCAVLSDGSDETISVLPKNWIEGDLAYWSDDKNFKKHYHNCVDLQYDWPSYTLIKVLHTSGFEGCQIFQKEYNTTCAESADDQEKPERSEQEKPLQGDPSPPRKKNKVGSVADHDDNEDTFSTSSSDSPPYVKKNLSKRSNKWKANDKHDDRSTPIDFRGPFRGSSLSMISTPPPGPSPPPSPPPALKQSSKANSAPPKSRHGSPRRSPRKHMSSHRTSLSSSSKVISSSQRSKENATPEFTKHARKMLGYESGKNTASNESARAIKEKYPLSTAEYQRRTINLMLDMQKDIKDIKAKLNCQNKPNKLYDRTERGKIESLEELLKYEDTLASQNEFEELIDLWQSVSGKDPRQYIGRILRVITTNAVLSQLNYDGSGGKTGFKTMKNLHLALNRCCKSKTGSEGDVELKNVLKDAPDREGGSRWENRQKK